MLPLAIQRPVRKWWVVLASALLYAIAEVGALIALRDLEEAE